MVEIFKTNVVDDFIAQQLITKIGAVYTNAELSFDLDDCDNVFRFYTDEDVVGVVQHINLLFQSMGFFALPLTDEFEHSNIRLNTTRNIGIKTFLDFI